MDMLLVYLILLAMGFVIVLLAFLMKESWRTKQAEVKIQKLGVDLKVQNNTLIVILGFVLLAASGFFLYRSDQEAIEKAKQAKTAAEEGIKAAQKEYEIKISTAKDHYDDSIREVRDIMLKEYHYEVNLLFDGVDAGSSLDNSAFYQKVSIKSCIKSYSGKEEKCAEGDELAIGKNGMRMIRLPPYGVKVIIEKIRMQDQVAIDARYTKGEQTYCWHGGMILPLVDMKLFQTQEVE